MAPDLEHRAKEAFVDDDFDLAVDLYTQALDMDPNNADLFADRAQANIKLQNFTEAVADANRAIELNPSMAKAYLRKGTACMKLEEYQTAKTALEAGFALTPGDSRFSKLIKECDELIAEEINDLSKRMMPDTPQYTASSVTTNGNETDSSSKPDVPRMPEDLVPKKPKYRHDYYNSPTEVVLTIFAKGAPENNVHIDFGEQILSITIDIPGDEPYHFQPRLFGKIIPDKCRYLVLSSKIEIRLAKAETVTWPSLEFSKDKAPVRSVPIPSAPTSNRPSYPSSKAKVDWDKLEAQMKKEEKEEKLDGDAALNKLFQDIYRNSDEDTRRAMSKSFVESNGTVLSTNWKDVGSKKVEESPPEGMQMKKWQS
ncbi:hypothetical protein J5N97_007632 [Dioscorea zingiberensis]|uniref:Protein SGT1 homolog n=1 Tax=Dioscorea zingiberensis TaxID=325984 RepID=A0A9D5DCB3_9LILI|nr:hypothetical protein J5N97_007632 [Dioscorea zingiberensis]